jgi:hypothetical protein
MDVPVSPLAGKPVTPGEGEGVESRSSGSYEPALDELLRMNF